MRARPLEEPWDEGEKESRRWFWGLRRGLELDRFRLGGLVVVADGPLQRRSEGDPDGGAGHAVDAAHETSASATSGLHVLGGAAGKHGRVAAINATPGSGHPRSFGGPVVCPT